MLFSSYCRSTYFPWQLLIFDVVPTFLDIIVALVVFAIELDWTLTLVIFVVLSAYSASWMYCSLFEFVLTPIQLWLAFFLHAGVLGCGAP